MARRGFLFSDRAGESTLDCLSHGFAKVIELVPILFADGRTFHLDTVGNEVPLAFLSVFGKRLHATAAPAHAAKGCIAFVLRLKLVDFVD